MTQNNDKPQGNPHAVADGSPPRQGNGLDLDDEDYGGFFTDLENNKPFIKLAFEGFPGSGKTFTMIQLAIGLHRRTGSTKPIAFFDTEKSAKFAKPMFAEAGIKVLLKESRSMADLIRTMDLVRSGAADILMIDSISHVWESFVEGYKAQRKRNRLEMLDWGVIKPMWKRQFSTPLVEDPYHILMAGRAAFEYDSEITEGDNGKEKREIFKSGIKMKAEGETAYEPDMLVLMERNEDVVEKEKRVWRTATVLKDRSNLIDGKTFVNPTFKDFEPAIDFCLADPSRKAKPVTADDASLFMGDDARATFTKRRDIALEELQGDLMAVWPSQTAEEKRLRNEAMFVAYGTRSWTAITQMKPEDIEAGRVRVQEFIKKIQEQQATDAA
jgi:hypothetical protein